MHAIQLKNIIYVLFTVVVVMQDYGSLCDNNTWKLCNDVPDVVQTPCVGEVLA